MQGEHPELSLTSLYNTIQGLDAGGTRDVETKLRGRVLILRELHDELDGLVMQSYGWAADLPSQDVLVRLAELNAHRRNEERGGEVRWLRPAYQARLYAAEPPSIQLQRKEAPTFAGAESAPLFPRDRSAQPVAVLQMLERLGRPQSVADLARGFRGRAKGVEQKISSALVTLLRYGRITAMPDGRYLARRAA